ncbi:udp-galactose transporter like protein [Pochonia chlamydosporia 170]|uniref:Udp-galactose transporter like protein n=1 Tax=Pochonia chlamydosporia 170 TaxID=1380566 RepID=A0A179FPB1_METCM|nr:udp-galactose transporter like protein [Pochonia chlamydosporia 170]OAQ66981.1 udp-galactose transporter like protein [Pochonia chlamydosporia 170]
MAGANDSFSNLEKYRLQLEENVNQLKTALQHWQTWDAEYEALKEEVEAIQEPYSPDELRRIHDEFDGELLIGKEIDEVFGLQELKSRAQIINVLQRRIDYVGKNVSSLEKQLETAENKYATATVVSQPDIVDEDGQPITEIIEELDDDDNVVSYRLNQPGNALPKVKEALEKAGVDDLQGETQAIEENAPSTTPAEKRPSSAISLKPRPTASPKPSGSETLPAPSAKKSVSFSEDVEVSNPPPAEMSIRAKRVDKIMRTAKEQESISNEKPIIPDDEDSDDAELRQQMLQYGMGEVGAVVAELDLEEVDSDDDSGFGYGDDDFDDDFDDEEGEEDKYGRYTGRVVTDKYRQRMLELEQRLGIKSRFTEQAEQKEDGEKSTDDSEGIGRIVVNREPGTSSSATKPAPSKSNIKERKNGDVEEKKGVRFAQALDIAPEDEAAAAQPAVKETPVIEPLGDVVERTSSTKVTEPKTTRKPSRFKKSRDDSAPNDHIPKGPFDVPSKFVQQQQQQQPQRTVPTGPEGSTIANTLVERENSSNVLAPDEFDDSMAHQEIADEYQRMRRKFIHRDGGFLKEDESVIQPLDEADGGQPMSRFKAARLSRQ